MIYASVMVSIFSHLTRATELPPSMAGISKSLGCKYISSCQNRGFFVEIRGVLPAYAKGQAFLPFFFLDFQAGMTMEAWPLRRADDEPKKKPL